MIRVHATSVELAGTAVLLRGPSGSGKSDLALRLIDGGARLVADDYTEIELRDGRLVASVPAATAGLLEVRGLGIVQVPNVAEAWLRLVVDLVPPDEVERLPEKAHMAYLGVELPLLALAPFESATPAKLRLAAHTIAQDIMPAP
ncbi:MAG: HPr kinase/phosphatase C-terminal domain-containing protein [Proteobacteria bacterium]|nr:HPr kinase/phosphatase C-terminal domain-containing protein [Pseudomonadota bacterium]